MKRWIIPAAAAFVSVAGGCSSELPRLDAPIDWAQREQDRKDQDNLFEDIVGNPKRWAQGNYSGLGFSSGGRAEDGTPVWIETVRAWVAEGVTQRNGVTWEWTALLRNLDGNGDPQQTPDGNTDRITVLLSADGVRVVDEGYTDYEADLSWTAFADITGLGTGTLAVFGGGTMDGTYLENGEETDVSAEFVFDATVPETGNACPSGGYEGRMDLWRIVGSLDAAGEEVDWVAYELPVEQGDQPIDSGSDPFDCEEI
jgi:hypothetical protein